MGDDEVQLLSSDEYRRRYGAEREPSPLSLERINELFHEFLIAVARPAQPDADGHRDLARRLREHLGSAPTDRPVVKAAPRSDGATSITSAPMTSRTRAASPVAATGRPTRSAAASRRMLDHRPAPALVWPATSGFKPKGRASSSHSS